MVYLMELLILSFHLLNAIPVDILIVPLQVRTLASPCITHSQQFLTNWLTMQEDILIHEVLRCPIPSPQRAAERGRLQ